MNLIVRIRALPEHKETIRYAQVGMCAASLEAETKYGR